MKMKSTVFLVSKVIVVTMIFQIRKAICTIPELPACSVTRIHNQSQFDLIINSYSDTNHSTITCIHLLLIGSRFNVDIQQLMAINFSSLAITAGNETVDIHCATNVTDLEELREMLQPISRAQSVLFDGLVFTQCPVPIVIEEVYNVMILNCVFL